MLSVARGLGSALLGWARCCSCCSPPPPTALSGEAPEFFYIEFTKEQTLSFARLLKAKSELLGFY